MRTFIKTLTVLLLLSALETSAQDHMDVIDGSNLRIGSNNTLISNGNNAVNGNAIGQYNYLESANTLAVGTNDTIGTYSVSAVALGASNRVQGVSALGFGCMVKVNGAYGVGLGHHIKANGSMGCMVIGGGITGTGGGPNAYLVNNVNNSLSIGFKSTKPTLFISESPNNYTQGILDKTGRIAIGDVSPQAKLHIRSDADEDAGIILVPADTANNSAFINLWDQNHSIVVNGKGAMVISADQSPITMSGATVTLNGKVGVNTMNDLDGYALAIDGGLIATKVYIQDVEDWHDEVFGEGYQLMPADELKGYLREHRHLPGVPSEAEVKANGYDVAVMQAAMLEKIEELTLHMLRQQEELDSLRELVTVHFGYDACGNRISRTLEFMRMDDERSQASLCDSFAEGDAMLFPNPTEAGFVLSLTGTDIPQNTTATLCTIDGKVVEVRNVSNATEKFDLTGRPSGIYLLRLASEREAKVWKIIKRK